MNLSKLYSTFTSQWVTHRIEFATEKFTKLIQLSNHFYVYQLGKVLTVTRDNLILTISQVDTM